MATTLEKILYLVPDAKCSVWPLDCVSSDNDGYFGEDRPHLVDDSLVDWRVSNKALCPTTEQVQALDDQEVEQELANRAEIARKLARDEEAKNNLPLMMDFRRVKASDPSATLTDYLDGLESFARGV